MISHKFDILIFCAVIVLLLLIVTNLPPVSLPMPNQQGSVENTNDTQTQNPASGNPGADARCKIMNYLPDPGCTPGATDPRVTQENILSTICVSGYTATVRPPVAVTNKIKTERMQAYGFTDGKSNYELDHLIPLELGGAPDSVSNLFPEPYAEPYGARDKDQVENYLHRQVCAGLMSLQTAQEEIRNNWVRVYGQCCAAK